MKKPFLVILFVISLVVSNLNLTFATAPSTTGAVNDVDMEQHYMNAIKELEQQLKDKEQTTVDKGDTKPIIKLVSPATFSVTAGKSTTIEFEIKNITSYVAKNLFVQATLADATNMPFTIKFLNSSNSFTSLSGQNTEKIQLVLDVDPLAEAKRYDINLEYSYSNTYNKDFTGKDTINIKVENTTASTAPIISISDFKLSANSIKPDSSIELNAVLQNLGTQDATDVQLVVDGLSTETLSITNNTNSMLYSVVKAGDKNKITFNIMAAKNIKQGNYPLTFKITYKDKDAKEQTNSQTFFISAEGSQETEKTFVQIQNLTVPADTYLVGKNFDIHLDIVNTGKTEAKNIKITSEYGTEGAVVPKSTSIQMLNSLESGGTKGFDFTFMATTTAKSQNYPIAFKLEYEDGTTIADGTNKIITYTQYTGVNISNPEADKKEETSTEKPKSIPKIIISKYSSNPIMVKAGEEFDLNMSFTNTHSAKTVKNIKIYITVSEESKTGNVFIPVNSSTTFYIDAISPKGTVDKSIRLFTMPDASPKTYNLMVNYDYEDETGALPASSETIGISVKQPTKLETSEVYIPTEGNVGEPLMVNFQFYNTGKVTLSNLRIKILGDFDTQNSDSYYGNLESGSSEYYEGTLIPNVAGKQSGKLIISYDEPNGERVERVTEIDLTVSEAPPMEAFSPDGVPLDKDGKPIIAEEPKKGIMDYVKSPILWACVAGVVVLIGGVIFFIIRRKKQKDKEDLND